MTHIPPKPAMVLAKIEGPCNTLSWWIERADGLWERWPVVSEGSTRHRIVAEARQLIVPRLDFERDRGSNAAIVRIQNARDKHFARAGA